MSKAEKVQLKKRMAAESNPQLNEILNRKNLDRHIANGIVKVATHPSLPLYLYDYSSLCERRNAWDGVTILTRGLLRDNKGTVVARPFQKFFSWGGKSTSAVPAFRWDDDWQATEKVDGTMIIASNYGGELMLTTRGSFDAWQIEAAMKLWPTNALPMPGKTWILEYCGPDNKIVLDYSTSRLYLLGAIDNWTGADDTEELNRAGYYEWNECPYPTIIARIGVDTPGELLACGRNDGTEEGFVLHIRRAGKPSPRLKVKYSAYNERHLEIFRKKND